MPAKLAFSWRVVLPRAADSARILGESNLLESPKTKELKEAKFRPTSGARFKLPQRFHLSSKGSAEKACQKTSEDTE